MPNETDKERADRMFDKGERDATADAPPNKPHQPLMEGIFGQVSDRDVEDNDNYHRGHTAGKK